ncbi:MAG: erythromycin esterase family protein [Alphaproteobacteria bacterium]
MKNFCHYIQSINNIKNDLEPLIENIGDSRFVLIGEETHGTHEFYDIRAKISKKLIEEKGFDAIAIEGDWPDTYKVNRYIKGDSFIDNSLDALEGFQRFPTWMWRNKVTLEFIEWLYKYNSNSKLTDRIGFYGLDLYSINKSIEEVINLLANIDVNEATKAIKRYSCFNQYKENIQDYGLSNFLKISPSCQEQVIQQLSEIQSKIYSYVQEGNLTYSEYFNIEQNAILIKNAEKYYRTIYKSKVESWNIRDSHMVEILENIDKYISAEKFKEAKIIVWAHNSHIGDARATQMGKDFKEFNIGQLLKEKYEEEAYSVGLFTNKGTVTAASTWDGEVERKFINPALEDSYEYFFSKFNIPNFLLNIKNNNTGNVKNIIPQNILERAIGVVYLPKTERSSHYFYADLAEQFDSVIYLENTSALQPLEYHALWHKGEVFETFPSGL